MSLRDIQRTFGAYHQSVMAWLGKNRATPAFMDTLLPGGRGDVLKSDRGQKPKFGVLTSLIQLAKR